MSKPDWAERKAARYVRECVHMRTEGELQTYLANILRLERRRAVRACQRLKRQHMKSNMPAFKRTYGEGCFDCARAVKG